MVGLETVGTNGTDDYGFSLLPLGYILGSEDGQIEQFVDAGRRPDHIGVTAITQNAYLKTSTMEGSLYGMTYRVNACTPTDGGDTLGYCLIGAGPGEYSNNGTGWPVYMPIRLIKDV
jgi:hypothetical protein